MPSLPPPPPPRRRFRPTPRLLSPLDVRLEVRSWHSPLPPVVGAVSLICWNIEGLVSRLAEPGFVDYISSYRICCFLETYTGENFDFSLQFDGYCAFHAPAVKLSHHGRRSGGVVMLIENSLARHVTRLSCACDNVVVARLYVAGYYDILLLVESHYKSHQQ